MGDELEIAYYNDGLMRKNNLIILLFQSILLFQVGALYAEVKVKSLSLLADNFEHITFSGVKPNIHRYSNQQLNIDVEASASFLMKAFSNVKQVNRLSFKWRSNGEPKIKNAEHEQQRSGDDAVFKVGLLLRGEDSFSSPFLPSWMKRVESLLEHPSENMIYLVVNAKHEPGEKWLNPYNERITMIAMNSVVDKNGWKKSSYRFESPVDVVGIWLMTDGDNTESSFMVSVKDIELE